MNSDAIYAWLRYMVWYHQNRVLLGPDWFPGVNSYGIVDLVTLPNVTPEVDTNSGKSNM